MKKRLKKKKKICLVCNRPGKHHVTGTNNGYYLCDIHLSIGRIASRHRTRSSLALKIDPGCYPESIKASDEAIWEPRSHEEVVRDMDDTFRVILCDEKGV